MNLRTIFIIHSCSTMLNTIPSMPGPKTPIYVHRKYNNYKYVSATRQSIIFHSIRSAQCIAVGKKSIAVPIVFIHNNRVKNILYDITAQDHNTHAKLSRIVPAVLYYDNVICWPSPSNQFSYIINKVHCRAICMYTRMDSCIIRL